MKTKILAKGRKAIDLSVNRTDVQLNKYADPEEGARENISVADAHEIQKQDPNLIFATRRGKRVF